MSRRRPVPSGQSLETRMVVGRKFSIPAATKIPVGCGLPLYAWPLKASVRGGKMCLENVRAENEVGVQ